MTLHVTRARKLSGQREKIKALSVIGDTIDGAFLQTREHMSVEQKALLDKELRLLRMYDGSINTAKQAQAQVMVRIEKLSKTVTQENK